VESGDYDTLLLADADLDTKTMFKIQELCGREMIDFMMIPSFVQTLTSCLHVESFQGTPLLTQTKRQLDRTSSILSKRIFDICGAIVGLVLFVPVVVYFCCRVYRESPGPVFYRQTRLGKNGRSFEIIKIRSMRLDAEVGSVAQWCVEDDPRRLEIGEFMRKYNIDELPQFWNVLKGEMSLVGPRPERPELIRNFKHDISYYNVRHTVKPGVTGWAQVSGWRGDTCLNSRIACDIEYIERWSVWFDLYICLRTFNARRNAY
jgi:exopolysaccharide biosynthesis polyprenyl glycosylphosphotransferase